MNVCHVVYNEFPEDPRVRRDVSVLAAAGFDVHVLCTRAGNEPRSEVWKGARVDRLPLMVRRGSRTRYLYQYAIFTFLVGARLLRDQLKHHYRIIHVHSLPDFLVMAAIPCRLLGAFLILDLHESSPELLQARFSKEKSRLPRRLLLFLQKLSCKVATHVITVNPRLARVLTERGLPSTKVTIVENAPDWESPCIAWHATTSMDEIPQVIIAGGLNRERDHGTVIRAAAQVLQRHRFRLKILGRGTDSYRKELKTLISELNIQSSVAVEGSVPHDAAFALTQATCFGIVSYERNPLTELATPNKAYEYAACGKPMVVADLPALRDLLGETVLYYVPGDPGDLAAKIQRLLEDPALRERLGLEVRARIRAHEWPVMEARLLTLYHDLILRWKSESHDRVDTPQSNAGGTRR